MNDSNIDLLLDLLYDKEDILMAIFWIPAITSLVEKGSRLFAAFLGPDT